MSACDACLRRGLLVGRLSSHLEVMRSDRRGVRGVLALDDGDLIAAVGGARARALGAAHAQADPGALRASMAAGGIAAVCGHDDAYPPGLRDLPDEPAVLFVTGSPSVLAACAGDPAATPAVAIVGARRASADGCAFARTLARDLVLAGVPVISGMALGIDAAAHRGALEGGTATVAVLGSGPDVAYPRTETRLHRELAERAVVISEMPPGSGARRWSFPARNRIIAGLARLTVVVEAAERSGSLITATYAQELGREVGAVPGRPTSTGTRGSNLLLRDGAAVILGAQDVLDLLFGVGARIAGSLAEGTTTLAPALRATLEQVRAGRETVAALCGEPGREVGEVMAALGELEFLGYLRRTGEGRYVAAA